MGQPIEIRAELTLQFGDVRTARAVDEATAVDNPRRGVRQAAKAGRLTFSAGPASAGSLRETLDDWLRCAAAAAEAARRAR